MTQKDREDVFYEAALKLVQEGGSVSFLTVNSIELNFILLIWGNFR